LSTTLASSVWVIEDMVGGWLEAVHAGMFMKYDTG
jgi:hypothetical protein